MNIRPGRVKWHEGREGVEGSPFGDERCRSFVKNLEKMLEGYGWKQADLARESKYSASLISEIMSFKRWPAVQHGRAFDSAFGLDDMFAAKARAIQGKPYAKAFEDFPAHEATAHDLYVYQHSVFPGLIQTERYARAVLAAWPNITADEIGQRVTGRMMRQEVVYRDDPRPPRLRALVDEAALRRPVAPADVMYEQCMKALEVSRLPHVSLAVVPYAERWHVGLLGACDIVERDGVPRVVNTDDMADGGVSEDPARVRRVALRFRSLQAEALPRETSRDMIARIAEELWNGTARTGARALTAVATADRV